MGLEQTAWKPYRRLFTNCFTSVAVYGLAGLVETREKLYGKDEHPSGEDVEHSPILSPMCHRGLLLRLLKLA